MRLQVLGSGNAFACGGRFHTCFYIEQNGYRFLLDCGASAIVAIQKFGVDLASLDAIVISHLHGDHIGGIPFVELASRALRGDRPPLKIIGPPGTASLVSQLFRLLFPEAGELRAQVIEYNTGVTEVDSLQITAQKAVHVPETNPHSLRIKVGDKVIAFSGDTEWHDNLVPLSLDADIFICECTSVKHAHRHMSHEVLREKKNVLCPKRMMITHLDDSMLGLQDCVFEKAFDGQVIVL